MPEVGLKLRPGVNVEQTAALNESGVSTCQLIRYRAGLPEKLGGWTKFYPFSLSGVPKDLHPWEDLSSDAHLGIGTTSEYAVITDGSLQDITPQTKTTNPTPNFSTTINTTTVTIVDPNVTNVTVLDSIFLNTSVSVGGLVLSGAYPISVIGGAHTYNIIANAAATATVNNGGAVPTFTTVSGSSIVTVNLTAHGQSVGFKFTFPISTAVGGVTVSGTYTVLSVPGANSFTIAVSNVATSSVTVAMNTSLAQIVYYINLGPPAAGTGFGVGGFGVGGFGTGTISSGQTGTPITATDWTSDNWGEVLLACPRNGGIYQWRPGTGSVNFGLVATAPIFSTGIFVAMPQQILVAYGSTENYPGALSGDSTPEQQDPMMVRWSDSGDYTNWVPSSLTQAGGQRISKGSVIRGGVQGPQQALIWTDIGVHAMSYLGPPFVFGFIEIASGCGLIGQHAAAILRGNVYWMSNGNFFVLGGGGVQVLPCSVWDIVFQDLNTDYADKIRACPNSNFSELSWEFTSTSGGGTENDTYVKLNIEEQTWDYGLLNRSAWTDQSVLGPPIGTTPQGIIYQHETSPDADGQPLLPSFRTGWFVIAEGQDFAYVDWLFPDMKFGYYGASQNASVQITVYVADYPNQTPRTYGPFTMTSAKNFINMRLRGRMISIEVSSSDLGTFWRMGLPRYRVARDGRR